MGRDGYSDRRLVLSFIGGALIWIIVGALWSSYSAPPPARYPGPPAQSQRLP